MKTELQISPAGDTLTILEGKALELLQPKQLKLAGNILSVGKFIAMRGLNGKNGKGLQLIDPALAVVIVNEADMSILLQLDPNNAHGTEVLGKLELTDELKQFHINTSKLFTREELIKLLRFNKRFFNNADLHADLLKSYQTMQIKTASELKQESDTRGNKGMNFNKTVDSANIPTEFVLHIPVFKGFDSKVFRVEICLDATDSSVRFWFESVELNELIIIERDQIFEEQLKECSAFPIIHQ